MARKSDKGALMGGWWVLGVGGSKTQTRIVRESKAKYKTMSDTYLPLTERLLNMSSLKSMDPAHWEGCLRVYF